MGRLAKFKEKWQSSRKSGEVEGKVGGKVRCRLKYAPESAYLYLFLWQHIRTEFEVEDVGSDNCVQTGNVRKKL